MRPAAFLIALALTWIMLSVPGPAIGAEAGEFPSSIDLAALDGATGFDIVGTATDEALGAVAAIGDLDADGFGDFAIGTVRTRFDTSPGRVFVVFGTALGLPATLDLSTLDGSRGFVVTGSLPGERLGVCVGGIGDLNGDGIDDFAMGAPGVPGGAVYVIFGSTSGFPALFDLSTVDGTNGFAVISVGRSDWGDAHNYSTIGAGDLNGDGIDDLAIGSPREDKAYVVFGSRNGFPRVLNVGNLDGTNGFALHGRTGTRTAASLAGADVNADGLKDLVLGAPAEFRGRNRSGLCYLYFGRANGFPANVFLADLEPVDGIKIYGRGVESYENFGSSVDRAGDVNHDGIDDIVLGAFGSGSALRGEAYVVFGDAAGFGASMVLGSTLDGTNGFRISGAEVGEWCGASVARAGDVNDDGIDDLLVGSPQAGAERPGRAYVVFGAEVFANELRLEELDGSNGVAMTGGVNWAAVGTTISAGSDINGDGVDDMIVGSSASFDFEQTFVVYGRTSCAKGTVNLGRGEALDTVYLQGSNGGADRTVNVEAGDLLRVAVLSPGAGSNGRFVLQAHEGTPSGSTRRDLPFHLGAACFSFLLGDGPDPVIVANNAGRRGRVGSSQFYGTPWDDPEPATTEFLLPALPAGTVLTFQAVSSDAGSLGPKQASTTNAVIVVVE